MVTLESLVPKDHLLRLIDAHISFDFTSEYTLAERLWPQLTADSLVIVDKGFCSAALLLPLQRRQGRHWLIPVRAGLKAEVLQTHGPGDVRLRMKVSPQARKKDPVCPDVGGSRHHM